MAGELFVALLVFIGIFYVKGLSMCSHGQVRGSFILINSRSYSQAVTCSCTFRVEQAGFITAATATVPETEDCKSQVVLDYHTERLIQCSKLPTYLFQAKQNSTGTISFRTMSNSHGNTKYSLRFCGPKLYFVCHDGEQILETERPANSTRQSTPLIESTPQTNGPGETNVGGITAGVVVPVLLVAVLTFGVIGIVRKRRRRHETEKSTVLRSPLPSIAKEVEESVKVVTLKDSTGPTSSNQESLYHVIEDEDGYLTYPVKDREGITRYSKTPTTYNNVQRFITDEECDNVNNAYLDVIK
ncbi:uncharacterized protein LOC125673311 isoform X2 [Ostrea edulis]|uniref:uncharacterized protein LOC125673311 isoform X2 n=1 Tax=Ostrea edulis TaxID=37623 RepID=UPI0024AEE828|nr:uncharacterized protein LOC125673311 isoform X2 [Ostrea edulis]